ncbi:MAG TPA: dihydrofolate reductase family protein [Methanotrichaceae archaeon]|nr:dihydrofolate reductase family protein [Methanotrichaceae archaeon]
MTEIVLYIASSLDGFIARKDGDVSWLNPYQTEGQDYGYSEFLSSIDIIVMGSRTFEQIPSFGPWTYGDIKTYVLTRRDLKIPDGAFVVLHSGRLDELLMRIREESQKGIWLVGGASVAQSFLRHKAIDEIIISFIPILLGQGISLFGDTGAESGLVIHESRLYQNGIVQLHYGVEYSE